MALRNEVVIHRGFRGEPANATVVHLDTLSQEAAFALNCIERWGMVQGQPDGEDSAGRAKLKLMDVSELVERAFTMARKAFQIIEDRGLTVTIPPEAERISICDAKDNKRENSK